MSNDKQHTENPIDKVQSHDWNKERLAQLKHLMPDLFTNEGNLNINELKKVIDPTLVNETERYEFRWFGKSNAKREAFTPTDATLIYDESRSVHPTESEHLIIEGENLAVLKLLSNSYREKIKCIYIDPPYNTGKDFVYSDKFNQDKKEYWEDAEMTENGYKVDTNTETDGRYHSNWLNMMYSRLLIARQLLKEDGVIFISIDDNEVHHLRKLCDEVFGEENFVALITLLCNPKGRSQDKHFATNHEYLLVFSKAELPKGSFNTKKDEIQLSKEYTEKDNLDFFRSIELRNTHREFGKHNRPNLYYPLYINITTGEVGLDESTNSVKVLPNWSDGFEGCWTWGKPKARQEQNLLIGKLVNKKWKVFVKNYASGATKMLKTIFNNKLYYTERGQKVFNELFETKEKIFPSPKSSFYIKELLQTSSSNNDLILDFFAGSGTTGQAVMELNEKDGGNRKYILVQLPEATREKTEAYKAGYKKISDITIERNKRVVEKIIKEKQEKEPDLFSKKEGEQAQLKGLGFKVFKLTKSNFPRVEFAPDPEKSDEENTELLKKYIKDKEAQLVNAFNKDELLTEILLKNGFKLNYTVTKQAEFKKNEILLASDGNKEALVCLDGFIEVETVDHFKTNTDKKLIVLERALDTTKKWNLKHYMGDKLNAF